MHNHQTPVKTEAYLKSQDLNPTTLNQLCVILPTASTMNGNDYVLSNVLATRDIKGLYHCEAS